MTRLFQLSLIAFVMFASTAMAGDVFVNSKWKIELTTTDAGGKDTQDTIIFIHNTFTSEFFEKHGFKPGAYDSEAHVGNLGTFTSENKGAEGTLKWTGSVSASSIKGDVVWTKPNGDEIHYSFSGEKVMQ